MVSFSNMKRHKGISEKEYLERKKKAEERKVIRTKYGVMIGVEK